MAANTGKNIGKQGLPVLNVGNPGNKGGTGRPPDEIRELCREGGWVILSDLVRRYKAGELTFTDHQLSLLEKCLKHGLPAQKEVGGVDGQPIKEEITVKWAKPPKPDED